MTHGLLHLLQPVSRIALFFLLFASIPVDPGSIARFHGFPDERERLPVIVEDGEEDEEDDDERIGWGRHGCWRYACLLGR